MRGALRLARKEFRDVVRERSILMAVLVQFFVAAFSAFLTVGLVGLYDPEAAPATSKSRAAYVGPGGFDAYLANSTNFEVVRAAYDDALDRFDRGDVAVVVEETYANATRDARTVTLLLPEAELRTTLVVTQLKALLRDYERDLRFDRAERIDHAVVYVETDARPNPYFAFAFGILLPLLVITPVFLAGAVTGDALVQEIETHTIHLLRASPLSTWEIVLGKLIAPVVLVPLQVILWILLLTFNGLDIHNVALLLLLSLTLGVLMTAAGVAIAFTTRREGQTQAVYTLAVLVLGALALLLPRDPFNLVARIAVGALDGATLGTVGVYGAVAALMVGLAFLAAHHRMVSDTL